MSDEQQTPTPGEIREAFTAALDAIETMANRTLEITKGLRVLADVENPRSHIAPVLEHSLWGMVNCLGDMLNNTDAADDMDGVNEAFAKVEPVVAALWPCDVCGGHACQSGHRDGKRYRLCETHLRERPQ